MLIVCPSCATAYDVKPANLQPNGRQVRCVHCRTVWRAELTQADRLIAAAEALAPEPERPAPEVPIAPAADEQAPQSAEGAAAAVSETERIDHPADAQAAGGQSLAAPAERLDPAPAAAGNTDSPNEPADSVELEAPPLAPADLDAGGPPVDIDADHVADHAIVPQEDIETFAARRFRRGARRRRWRWSLSRLQTVILALLIVDSILVGWRKDVVRLLPQTASFYALMGLSVNVRGLAFEGVATSTEQHDGVPILVVEGHIVNDAGNIANVPRLKLAVRNAAREEIYSWTAAPPRARLSPGEAVAFRTRLASPPPDSRDVLVRFVNRRDIVAGVH
jgi:predicted Zn finger-like uncharacterized protein